MPLFRVYKLKDNKDPMKQISKSLVLVVMAVTLGFCYAQAAMAIQSRDTASKDRDQSRTLTGTVVDKGENPLPSSVVYLKNTKTLAVKSFIADDSGGFRFTALSPNADYEVYAEFNGQRSSTKTLSSFDSRPNVQLQLKIDVKK
jgi:carboxypeptidase family protein